MRIVLRALLVLTIFCFQNLANAHPLDALRDLKAGESQKPPSTSIAKRMPHASQVLVLFYSSQCPHCQAFAPVIQSFAAAEHWTLESITVDGNILPGFRFSLPADDYILQQAFHGQAPKFPALFLADKTSNTLVQIANGNISYQEIAANIQQGQALLDNTRQGRE